MIELTNEQIMNVNQSIKDLLESKVILNIKVSYKLARARKIIQSFANTIQQEQINLYQKYGEPAGENQIRVPAEKLKDFTNELEELMKINNNVEIEPINIDEFGDVEIDFNIMDGLMNILDN
jgi:hypothetical protein